MSASKSCTSVINLLCLVLFLSTALARGATIRVPADQATIQAGINAASNGDIVLVAPGTYYENIDFKGKAITVTSSDGAAKTIIDGSNGGSVVQFVNHELRSSVISNFTLRNGTALSISTPTTTAGVFANDSAPTILNNIITSNACNGINADFAAPLIQGNIISNTIANNKPGANCYAVANTGVLLGGLYTQKSTTPLYPTVIGNTIESNLVAGAIELWAADHPVIQGNIIRNNKNVSNYDAGGITSYNTDAVSIIGNLIYGNVTGASALQGGAGIKILAPGQSLGPFFRLHH